MFEHMEITEYIYEVVVEHSYKNRLGNIPTVPVTSRKGEEKPPRQILNPI